MFPVTVVFVLVRTPVHELCALVVYNKRASTGVRAY